MHPHVHVNYTSASDLRHNWSPILILFTCRRCYASWGTDFPEISKSSFRLHIAYSSKRLMATYIQVKRGNAGWWFWKHNGMQGRRSMSRYGRPGPGSLHPGVKAAEAICRVAGKIHLA